MRLYLQRRLISSLIEPAPRRRYRELRAPLFDASPFNLALAEL